MSLSSSLPSCSLSSTRFPFLPHPAVCDDPHSSNTYVALHIARSNARSNARRNALFAAHWIFVLRVVPGRIMHSACSTSDAASVASWSRLLCVVDGWQSSSCKSRHLCVFHRVVGVLSCLARHGSDAAAPPAAMRNSQGPNPSPAGRRPVNHKRALSLLPTPEGRPTVSAVVYRGISGCTCKFFLDGELGAAGTQCRSTPHAQVFSVSL